MLAQATLRRMAIAKSADRPCPARERAGYSDQARLRGLPQATCAAFVTLARPVNGRATQTKPAYAGYPRPPARPSCA